ncbi:MAG TPA: hypothetical protein VHL08_06860 [Dongiaceae bacterium]|nr:hypothetical protein [Dongiaceae bacterium]
MIAPHHRPALALGTQSAQPQLVLDRGSLCISENTGHKALRGSWV